jgi:hypothetical protein
MHGFLPDSTPGRPATPDAHTFHEDRCHQWVATARRHAAELLLLAGTAARPAAVRHETVHNPAAWPFGRFMSAWLDETAEPRVLRHLPDAGFFMRLLEQTYAPELRSRPDRALLLAGDTRLEVSLTNDALQIQLQTIPDYSMVRHHALMLFEATLWLEEPARSGWLSLYDELAGTPETRPGLDEVAAIEAGAFDDFTALSARTLEADGGESLLADTEALRRVLSYQRCAATAVGLLWRGFRDLSSTERTAWHAEHLAQGYLDPNYLTEEWKTA